MSLEELFSSLKIIPLGITPNVSLWNNRENHVDAPFPP
jgi:hypothetical protein